MPRSRQQKFKKPLGCAPRKRRLAIVSSFSTREWEELAVTRSFTMAMPSFIISVLISIVPVPSQAQSARDPGPRAGAPAAGAPLDGLTGPQTNLFNAGIDEFKNIDKVSDGLGPRMNLDSCAGCHAQPAVGGTSPPGLNPQFDFFEKNLQKSNRLPRFITRGGPVREARFKLNADGKTPDGGVHSIFTITGLAGADGCILRQPNFARELRRGNMIFRIPTPVFGAGLIEQIPDQVILDNQAKKSGNPYGIRGRVNIINAGHAQTGRQNRNGNDGTISRFGWKAQNKSLLVFAGEAYNVEMGISNELFQTEREENPKCQFKPTPNDTTNPDNSGLNVLSDIEKFASFMRFLAPPAPSQDTPGGAASIAHGKELLAMLAAPYATRQPFRPALLLSQRSAERRQICTPTLRFTTWGMGSPTGSVKARPRRESFGPPPSGDSDSASSSFMTAGPRI